MSTVAELFDASYVKEICDQTGLSLEAVEQTRITALISDEIIEKVAAVRKNLPDLSRLVVGDGPTKFEYRRRASQAEYETDIIGHVNTLTNYRNEKHDFFDSSKIIVPLRGLTFSLASSITLAHGLVSTAAYLSILKEVQELKTSLLKIYQHLDEKEGEEDLEQLNVNPEIIRKVEANEAGL